MLQTAIILAMTIGELTDKILSILLPILMSVSIIVAICTIIINAIKGKLSSTAEGRKETWRHISFILIMCAISFSASSIVMILKDWIVGVIG